MRINSLSKILVSVLFFCIPLILSAQEITYPQAVQQVLSQNGNLKASEQTVLQREYEKRASAGLYMPQITLDAKYTILNDDLTLDATLPFPPPIGTQHISYPLQDQKFFKAEASLYWPVFTGGQISAANAAAVANYNQATASLDEERNKTLQDLTSKYFTLQLAYRTAELRKEVYKSMQQHYDNAVSQERAGTIPRVERMHAEVNMNEAHRDYTQSLKDIDIAKAALQSLLATETDPRPVTPLFILAPAHLEPVEYFMEIASNESPQVQELAAAQDLARAGIQQQDATFFPSIYLFGNYELYRAQLQITDPDWYVGIGAQWKIFEGFSGYNKAIAAKKTAQSVLYKSKQARRDLATAAEVYYKQLLKAYDQYEAARDSLEFTDEYYRVRVKSFEAGLSTSVDVVDARNALSKNRLDIMSAAYQYDVALSQLLAVCGMTDKFDDYRSSLYAEIIQ